jgi:hypothetical protein
MTRAGAFACNDGATYWVRLWDDPGPGLISDSTEPHVVAVANDSRFTRVLHGYWMGEVGHRYLNCGWMSSTVVNGWDHGSLTLETRPNGELVASSVTNGFPGRTWMPAAGQSPANLVLADVPAGAGLSGYWISEQTNAFYWVREHSQNGLRWVEWFAARGNHDAANVAHGHVVPSSAGGRDRLLMTYGDVPWGRTSARGRLQFEIVDNGLRLERISGTSGYATSALERMW